jgi:hypothetical protein
MVGNVAEYTRDVTFRDNAQRALVKGASWRCGGCLYGIAPITLYYALDVKMNETGFRCVIERPVEESDK